MHKDCPRPSVPTARHPVGLGGGSCAISVGTTPPHEVCTGVVGLKAPLTTMNVTSSRLLPVGWGRIAVCKWGRVTMPACPQQKDPR